jgi:two-component system, NtrC family, nitrogen regulation response regulator GlnG
MFAIFRYLEAIAPSLQPVLITGETGTGKELVARSLHRLSARPGELVAVNVAGLDDTIRMAPFIPSARTGLGRAAARIVCATNCDVVQSVSAGTFRKDLYYRLRTHHLHLPPLRARTGDLPLLVHHFVDKAARALAKTPPTVPLALY